jgi:hypothetical protein
MQTSIFGVHSRNREIRPGQWRSKREGFFDVHPPSEIVRGVVFSSILWGLLAVGVYTVYAVVVGVY